MRSCENPFPHPPLTQWFLFSQLLTILGLNHNCSGSCKIVDWKPKTSNSVFPSTSLAGFPLWRASLFLLFWISPLNLFKFSVLTMHYSKVTHMWPAGSFRLAHVSVSPTLSALWTFLWHKLSKARFVLPLPHPDSSHFPSESWVPFVGKDIYRPLLELDFKAPSPSLNVFALLFI